MSPQLSLLPALIGLSLGLGPAPSAPPEDPLAEAAQRETKHYRLLLAGDEPLLDDYALLAEAAWSGFQAELELKSKTKRGALTTVRLYSNRRDWEAGMGHQQVFPLPGTNWIHYEPRLETVYVYGDLDAYHARKMLLYGLFRQYHLRCKSKNQDLTREWFITGMADAFSTHGWNGARLELGAHRLLTSEQRASLAVARGALDKLSDGELSIEDLSDWDVRWALTGYLMYGDGGAYRKDFQKLALGKRGSMLLGHDFLSNLGEPEAITAGLHAWLVAEARALDPLHGSWSERAGVLRGEVARGREFAIALGDATWTQLACEPGPEPKVARGLVLDWNGSEDCKLALQQLGVLRVLHVTEEGAEEVEVFDLEDQRGVSKRLTAELDGDEVILRAGDQVLGTYPAVGRRLGLAIQEGRASFGGVDWAAEPE